MRWKDYKELSAEHKEEYQFRFGRKENRVTEFLMFLCMGIILSLSIMGLYAVALLLPVVQENPVLLEGVIYENATIVIKAVALLCVITLTHVIGALVFLDKEWRWLKKIRSQEPIKVI